MSVSTSLTRLHQVFELAMRIGEVMISNGAAAADVTATMLRVTASSGIRNVSVQTTLTEVSVSYYPDTQSAPFTRISTAGGYTYDFTKLDRVDEITTKYVKGEMDLHEALLAVDRVRSMKRYYGPIVTTLAWVLMGGACAMFFGAGILVTAFAAFAAGVLWQVYILFDKLRLPVFYAQIAGGFIVVLISLVVNWLDPTANSSLVVVACLVMVLAGSTSVGAMQDAITGWYVTAAGRVLETFMLTVGAVIGIRGGMLIAEWVGADISITSTIPATLISTLLVAIAGALIGLGFAVGFQVPPRLLHWVTLLPGFTATASFLIEVAGLERAWATGITAFFTGVFAVAISQHAKAYVNILIAPAIITMVPGSVIYRGLLGLSDGSNTGAGYLLLACEIAIAISAGVILGELVASRAVTLLASGRVRVPAISQPFSTNRRRRMVTFRRRRKPGALTTAIPVVHLDPGELDPTIDLEAGPEWREDVDNLQPEVRESGFEIVEMDPEDVEMPAIRSDESADEDMSSVRHL